MKWDEFCNGVKLFENLLNFKYLFLKYFNILNKDFRFDKIFKILKLSSLTNQSLIWSFHAFESIYVSPVFSAATYTKISQNRLQSEIKSIGISKGKFSNFPFDVTCMKGKCCNLILWNLWLAKSKCVEEFQLFICNLIIHLSNIQFAIWVSLI